MNDYSYLSDLGYSDDEIKSYLNGWAEGITGYLADNAAKVKQNMMYLQDSFSKDLLLKLSVIYCDTFVLSPSVFKERIDLLKSEFPDDWTTIVEQQFWGYDGFDSQFMKQSEIGSALAYQPYLETISTGYENAQMAIETLKHPATRIYKFFVILKKEFNFDISADEMEESFLLSLECFKYDLERNIRDYLEHGIDKDVICDILRLIPFALVNNSYDTLVEKLNGYPQKINDMDIDDVVDILDSLS